MVEFLTDRGIIDVQRSTTPSGKIIIKTEQVTQATPGGIVRLRPSGGQATAQEVSTIKPAQQAVESKPTAQAVNVFPSPALFKDLKLAGAPLILTAKGFEDFKAGRMTPTPSSLSIIDKVKSSLGIASDLLFKPFVPARALIRGGAAVGGLVAGVPTSQIPAFAIGKEGAISSGAAALFKGVVGTEGITAPGGLLTPPVVSGSGIIGKVLSGQPSAAADSGISGGDKVLIGLALLAAIVFLGKRK